MVRIGILALQGALIEHQKKLEELGAETFQIKQVTDLKGQIDGLVLPGGESTVQGKLLKDLNLLSPLQKLIEADLPVLATCAGLILLAKEIDNQETTHLASLPVSVKRNAYGRQLGSFKTNLSCRHIGQVPATFIRAPYISRVSSDVEVLASHKDKVVAVQYQKQIGLAFHPELDESNKIHRYFLRLCQN